MLFVGLFVCSVVFAALVVLLLLSVFMFCSMLRDAPVCSLVAVDIDIYICIHVRSCTLMMARGARWLQSAHRIVLLQLAVGGLRGSALGYSNWVGYSEYSFGYPEAAIYRRTVGVRQACPLGAPVRHDGVLEGYSEYSQAWAGVHYGVLYGVL